MMRMKRLPSLGFIRMIPDVLHDVLQAQPRLRRRGDDLVRGQQESIASGVPQLKGERVFDANVVRPVNAAAAGWI